MQKNAFTLAEAAELLRCHPETLRKSIADGRLPAARLGRGYRVSRADLQTFWKDMGGGELFDRSAALEDSEATPPAQAERTRAAKKRDGDPRQLTLPF